MWAKMRKVVIVSGRDMGVEDKKPTVLRNWTDSFRPPKYEHLGDLVLESSFTMQTSLSQRSRISKLRTGTSNDEGPVISLLTLSSGL